MKKLVIISLGFAISVSSFAQISIGKHDTHPSAILELESKSQGFLLPRMTNAERLAIKEPAQGLQVYVTDFREGTIMFYEADKWKAFTQLGSRPNAPTEVQASVVTNASGEVEITFTPPSDNGGSDIISYKVTPILGGVTGTTTEVDASGNASTKVTGLAIGESYTFTVKATNAIGTSLPSEASNSITIPAQVGDFYQGGVVFYIAPTPADLDGDGNEDQGLICAIEDQGEVPWNNGINPTTEAINIAIGTGANNTSVIIDKQGEQTDYAAGLARAYRGGGYTDWFLPSKDELNEMYDSKSILEDNSEFTEIGNSYWSSSEYDKYKAWSIFYSSSNHYSKNFSLQVRPIRAF